MNRAYPKAVSILGAAACLGFLAITLLAKPEAWIIGVTVLAVGAIYYWVRARLAS
jgi:hypothetical protein